MILKELPIAIYRPEVSHRARLLLFDVKTYPQVQRLVHSRNPEHCRLERERGAAGQDLGDHQEQSVQLYLQAVRARHEGRFGYLQGGRQLQRRGTAHDHFRGDGADVLCGFNGTSQLYSRQGGRLYAVAV